MIFAHTLGIKCIRISNQVLLTISPSSPPKSSQSRRAPSSADILNLSKDLLQSGVGGDPGLTLLPTAPLVPGA